MLVIARARGVVCGRWRVRAPVPDEENFFSFGVFGLDALERSS